MKSKANTSSNTLQKATFAVAGFALLLSAFSLYFAIITLQSQESIAESLAVGSHNNTVKIHRMHVCIEENINPCNIDDLSLPVDPRMAE